MYIIDKNIKKELIIKNSRFITILLKITDKNEINKLITNLKDEYPKATHYCYAYIIDNYKKASDDGEPGGTAGMPILNILEKNDLTNVLAVVVRYFGGIKLGAGGLVRAYSKSVRDTLEEIKLIELEKGTKIKLEISYEEQKNIDYILKNSTITNKDFTNKIIYEVLINNKTLEKLNNYNYQVIENTYIEKKDD